MKRFNQFALLFLCITVFSCPPSIAEEAPPRLDTKPPLLQFYMATVEEQKGFERGQHAKNKALFCGPKIDFSKHIFEASCSREPGDGAPYDVFIFLDKPGGEKLKELSRKSLKQFVAIDVNGKSVGISKIQVVHELMNYKGSPRGLITFSVGQDEERGNGLARKLNLAK